jgi:hypothetical protein
MTRRAKTSKTPIFKISTTEDTEEKLAQRDAGETNFGG